MIVKRVSDAARTQRELRVGAFINLWVISLLGAVPGYQGRGQRLKSSAATWRTRIALGSKERVAQVRTRVAEPGGPAASLRPPPVEARGGLCALEFGVRGRLAVRPRCNTAHGLGSVCFASDFLVVCAVASAHSLRGNGKQARMQLRYRQPGMACCVKLR